MHSPGRSVLYSCTHQADQCCTPVLTRQISAVGMHSPGRSVQYSCTHQADQCRTHALTRGISTVLKHSPGRPVPYSCTHKRNQCRTHALTREISAVLMHSDVGELSEAGRPNVGFVRAVFVNSHHCAAEDEDIKTIQCCGR